MEIVKIFIGVVFLGVGVFLGELLARITKEELKYGQIWFKLIIIFGLLVGFFGLIFGNDVLLFSGFFIAIVASRSLK